MLTFRQLPFLIIILLSGCTGLVRFRSENGTTISGSTGRLYESGEASYYGGKFHGRKTANGEIFDSLAYTAAHKTLPFNTKVRVENSKNGKSVIVRINDRGPFAKSRIIDISVAAAREIDIIKSGKADVDVYILE